MAEARDRLDDRYIFSTGEAAAARLRLTQQIYGPGSEALLAEAGLRPGLRVAEMGCGVGAMACHLARTVGPAGEVVALDVSAEQLRLAEAALKAAGLGNVRFVEASATATGLPGGGFDLVYCRHVLSHVRDRSAAIREFRRLLNSGGVLVCEDLIASRAFSSPDSAAYSQLAELVPRFAALRGVDYCIGGYLPRLLRSEGFLPSHIRMVQHAYYRGEEKRWWELSIREAMPAFMPAGLLTTDECVELLRCLEETSLDPDVLVGLPVMTQVVASCEEPCSLP
jgi:ubiquinone/menaquinone biosynthesis C-methylase UbiE